MSSTTRSKVDLSAKSIFELQYNPSANRKNKQALYKIETKIMPNTTNTGEAEKESKVQVTIGDESKSNQIVELREYEKRCLQSVKMLTEDEMVEIDKWLAHLHEIYEELHYPSTLRLHQTTMYFLEKEKQWYEKEKSKWDNDWTKFCEKLTAHTIDRCQQLKESVKKDAIETTHKSEADLEQIASHGFTKYFGVEDPEEWLSKTSTLSQQYQLSQADCLRIVQMLMVDKAYIWYVKNAHLFTDFSTFSKLFLQRFTSVQQLQVDNISSMFSQLSMTMAREIIKTPTYFRGSKDDVFDWLEKLEHRFKMANWEDEHKLRYVSIHLQEDAYRWWSQAADTITSWSMFVEKIKQAFGSTKMKELAFEQLKVYRQSIHQSITQYYDRTLELCKRVDSEMSDGMKLQYLMAGVKDSLKLHISLHDPQTTTAFLSYARKLEDILSLTSIDYESQRFENERNITNIQQNSEKWIKQGNKHPAHQMNYNRNSGMKDAQEDQKVIDEIRGNLDPVQKRKLPADHTSIKCYNCGTFGHIARNCTRSHFD